MFRHLDHHSNEVMFIVAKTDLVALNSNPGNFVIILQYLIFDYQHQSWEHFVTAIFIHFFSS